jgi:transposase
MSLSRLKSIEPEQAGGLYQHPANCLIARLQKEHIDKLSQSIELIEKRVLHSARQLPCYKKLMGLPGVGRILAMTISMEVGQISRFKTAGHFASYCRTVDAKRISNNKKKGENNRKCGNKYLAWAFVEAANFARRHHEHCRRWFDRKSARTSSIIATKALACKLAKAAWHVMTQRTDYDPERMCPGLSGTPTKLEFVRTTVSQQIGVSAKPLALIGGRGSPQSSTTKR